MSTVTVEVTVGGALVRYIPEGESGNRFALKCETAQTLQDIIELLGISESQPLLIILNGKVVQNNEYAVTFLNDNDALSLMPPLAAG